jgi:choline dehydrogenase-like flavoprotein/nucleoside-diphosphate-sugar epimerase
MPHIELRSLTCADILDCDVCIIGSGPAGGTIARELSGCRLRVTVLESGGFKRQEHADQLNEIESVGRSRIMDQWLVRNRIVGGSSHTWGGRCAPFDEVDLLRRNWIPHSGWPFCINDLEPYLARTAAYLGLCFGTGFSDDRFWTLAQQTPPRPELDPSYLLPFFWQTSRDAKNQYDNMRFGQHLLHNLESNVKLVSNATVLQINVTESGSAVKSVEFVSADRQQWTLSASAVVVCAGGIENARILLCSNNLVASGLGNQNDLVGRFLMDHLRGPVATFRGKPSDALKMRFGMYRVKTATGVFRFRHGMRLSPSVQYKEQLLNCSAWINEWGAADDPWYALKRLLRGNANLPKDAMAIVSNANLLVRDARNYYLRGRGLFGKIERLDLVCMCEQRPSSDSRLTLSEKVDRLGQRLPRIDWRIHQDEHRTMRRMAGLVAAEFSRIGFERPILEEWVRNGESFPNSFQDIAHPAGTTRMANDPSEGVVDSECQVHGVQGLYVAGSSVFPTSGHCNPTQMIVALAIRLADTLKLRIASRTSPMTGGTSSDHRLVHELSEASVPASPRTRVLVTGASGRIGRHVVAELVRRGYQVRALTSKATNDIPAKLDAVEWRQLDFQRSLDFDAAVCGCAAVIHLAAEIYAVDRMLRVNVEATQALAQASERAGVKLFCYTSSIAVYGSGLRRLITENSPVLTQGTDVKSEYWADDWLRSYGRTKLQGENVIAREAQTVEYVILRPTRVVDIEDLIMLDNWGWLKKSVVSHRYTNHIYVRDVADAIIWFIDRSIGRDQLAPGVSVYNLSEDEFAENTYAHFFKKASAISGKRQYRAITVPWPVDWLSSFLKFRTFPLRHPLGRMIFSSSKLREVGYTVRFGMAYAHRLAFNALKPGAGASVGGPIDVAEENVDAMRTWHPRGDT